MVIQVKVGCVQKRKGDLIGKFQDLTGQRFGRLTVIERAENDKQNRVQWLCKCECGNLHTTQATSLKRETCRSCGCITKENKQRVSEERQLQLKLYDLSGEYGIGYTNKGEEFYFDLEDYNRIKDYTWYINNNGYVEASINKTHSKLRMHRLVMNVLDPNICVDHIHHNKNDNRKSQLRLVTSQQNQFNTIKPKDNTSGYKGVYWHKNKHKWEALIQCNGKSKYLGMYDDINDAIKAREAAEAKFFGEYRYVENKK